jgi:hypothetical protein
MLRQRPGEGIGGEKISLLAFTIEALQPIRLLAAVEAPDPAIHDLDNHDPVQEKTVLSVVALHNRLVCCQADWHIDQREGILLRVVRTLNLIGMLTIWAYRVVVEGRVPLG